MRHLCLASSAGHRSFPRRKSHKNFHVYTCSPYVKCHAHILAILVYIQYVFFSYGPTLICGTIVLEHTCHLPGNSTIVPEHSPRYPRHNKTTPNQICHWNVINCSRKNTMDYGRVLRVCLVV